MKTRSLTQTTLLLVALAFVAAPGNSSAATIVASNDTYVQGTNNGAINFGTSATLFSQDFSRASSFLTFLQFDLSGYVPGSFTSATLQLTVPGSSTAFATGQVFNIVGLNNSENGDGWDETTLTYNGSGGQGISYSAGNSWISQDIVPARTQILGNVAQGAPNATVNFSNANLVSFLNADTDGLVTLILAANGPYPSNPALTWASKENTALAGPTLIFEATVVPEPSTTALFGIGVLCAVLRRRR